MNDTTQLMQSAVLHHRAGHVEQAEHLYRQVLEERPHDPHVLHSLGVITFRKGQVEQAAQLVGRAIQADPQVSQFYNTLGVILDNLGRVDEALTALRQAIDLRPDYIEAYNNMAITLQTAGRIEEAIEVCRKALEVQPTYARAYHTMGFCLHALGHLDEAITSYQKALALDPSLVEVYNQLGVVFSQQERFDEAVGYLQQAVGRDPQYAEAHNNLGIVRRALGQMDRAIECYRKAIQIQPRFPEAHYNLANALKELGDCDRSIACYDQAIGLRPDYADAHWNRALAFLLKGDLKQGWKEYPWRHKANLDTSLYPHVFSRPRWQGEPLADKRLLVYCEQGLGDAIQFIRFVPQIKALGAAEVILETWPPLVQLLKVIPCVDRLVEASTQKLPEDEFDLCVSIMDLPRVFGTSLDTIPGTVPYLYPEPAKVGTWQQRLTGPGLKVGIVWAGRPTHGNDANRSCRLEPFLALAKIDGVQLYGLQKGPAASQVHLLPSDISFTNLGEEFTDLMDAACCMEAMDLVISVDTAMAHLAGALGRPVWTLLPFAPDWRWMLHRDDSPWYPTMRLFRQGRPKDWDDVFAAVGEQLRILSAEC